MLSFLSLYFYENYNILILFIIINLFLIYFYSFFAVKINLLDVPDQRKRHAGSIPLIGGLVIYTSISTTIRVDLVPLSPSIKSSLSLRNFSTGAE